MKEGDFLIAIDGTTLQGRRRLLPATCRSRRAEGRASRSTRRPPRQGARTYEVEPLRSEHDLRYNRWIDRQHRTPSQKASDGRRRLHAHQRHGRRATSASSTSSGGRSATRKGLIIDVRRNGGGWTEYFIIDKLERQAGGLQRPARHGAVPLPRAPSATAATSPSPTSTTARTARRSSSTSRPRKLGTGRRRARRGAAWSASSTASRPSTTARSHQSNNAFYGETGQWLGREPRRRPGHPGRQRPRLGRGRPRPPAREGHRGRPRKVKANRSSSPPSRPIQRNDPRHKEGHEMGKSIKGTETEKNLLTAFAGESQARNRYTYFAGVATQGGLRADRRHLPGDRREREGARQGLLQVPRRAATSRSRPPTRPA
ncbi:MAG: hypothetical protein MZW92_60510 [Comamonadaceae bacterium]|nr:hypothetical protein [Comamonadaceae bacterium]